MQKRGLLILLLISSINLVSAQVSLGQLFDKFGGENLFLLGTFLILFVLINFVLSKVPVFHDRKRNEKNKTVPAIISVILSVMIVYGFYKMKFDVRDFFSGFGVASDVLQTIVAIVIIIAIIYGFKKLKNWVFLILGTLLVVVSFTDLVYETQIVMLTGLAFLGLWLLVNMFFPKKKKPSASP